MIAALIAITSTTLSLATTTVSATLVMPETLMLGVWSCALFALAQGLRAIKIRRADID